MLLNIFSPTLCCKTLYEDVMYVAATLRKSRALGLVFAGNGNISNAKT